MTWHRVQHIALLPVTVHIYTPAHPSAVWVLPLWTLFILQSTEFHNDSVYVSSTYVSSTRVLKLILQVTRATVDVPCNLDVFLLWARAVCYCPLPRAVCCSGCNLLSSALGWDGTNPRCAGAAPWPLVHARVLPRTWAAARRPTEAPALRSCLCAALTCSCDFVCLCTGWMKRREGEKTAQFFLSSITCLRLSSLHLLSNFLGPFDVLSRCAYWLWNFPQILSFEGLIYVSFTSLI